MNEAVFLLQILVILGSLWGAWKIGKEALIALSVLLAILANFFVLKQVELFGWNVTCSDPFAIGSIFGLNLIQKGFGREAAKKTIWISLWGMVFFVIVSQIHLQYEPSRFDSSQGHFMALLAPAPRLLFASMITFFIVQQLDVRIYGFLKRNTPSLFLSQAIDTVLFSFLGLYGIVQEIGSIIMMSYCVKCAVILITTASARFFQKPLSNEI